MKELERASYLSLGTYRRSGVPVDTPVWFAIVENRLWVFSELRAGKIKRLRNSDRARVAVCDVRGNVKDAWRDARARIVVDPAAIRRAHTALRKKYGWQMLFADFFSSLAGRIKNRAFIEIELEP